MPFVKGPDSWRYEHPNPPMGPLPDDSIYHWPFAVFVVIVAWGFIELVEYIKTLL
jgi:hypothetical protein